MLKYYKFHFSFPVQVSRARFDLQNSYIVKDDRSRPGTLYNQTGAKSLLTIDDNTKCSLLKRLTYSA